MFQKFNELLESLNDELKRKLLTEDTSVLESSMEEVLDAWTDYMMWREEPPTDDESIMYHNWLELITKW